MKQQSTFVSGYFNPLHSGHIELFERSKQEYPYNELVVIVNNDIQAIKKHGHAFLDEKTRIDIIRSIRWVDFAHLSISEDDSVSRDLQLMGRAGDVFVNSGDRNDRTANMNEVDVCLTIGIEIVYLSLPKRNSSSVLLSDYYKRQYDFIKRLGEYDG